MKKISEMIPSELRIACAEKCGWKNIRWNETLSGGYFGGDTNLGFMSIPHYDTDRNALHELIMAVPEDKREHFVEFLTTIIREKINYKDQHDIPKLLYTFLTADSLSIMRAFLEVMG